MKNEASKKPCGCNPCTEPSCNCGCRNGANQTACACGPQCRCREESASRGGMPEICTGRYIQGWR